MNAYWFMTIIFLGVVACEEPSPRPSQQPLPEPQSETPDPNSRLPAQPSQPSPQSPYTPQPETRSPDGKLIRQWNPPRECDENYIDPEVIRLGWDKNVALEANRWVKCPEGTHHGGCGGVSQACYILDDPDGDGVGNHIMHGPYWYSYPNGKPKTKGSFKNGKPDGKITSWWENGNLQSERVECEGRLCGPQKAWYEKGQLKHEGDIAREGRPGWSKFYWEDGRMSAETAPEGMKYYDRQGKPIDKRAWEDLMDIPRLSGGEEE